MTEDLGVSSTKTGLSQVEPASSLAATRFDPSRGQYRFVGPALFVLETMPDEAQLVRHNRDGRAVDPAEVWIGVLHTWLRLNGEWISGWEGDNHFGFRPSWLNRWKIRRAARRWAKSTESTPA